MALIQGKSGAEVGIGYMLSYNGGIWKLESCYLSSSVTERWLAPQHRPVREIRRVLGACRKDCQEGLEWGLELTEVQDWTPLPVTQRSSAWHVPQASRASSVRNDISYCLNRNFASYSHNSPNKYTQKEGKPQRVALGMHIKICQKLYIGQAFSSGTAFPLPSSHHPGKDRSKHSYSTDISSLTKRRWNMPVVLTGLGFGGLADVFCQPAFSSYKSCNGSSGLSGPGQVCCSTGWYTCTVGPTGMSTTWLAETTGG